MSEQHDWYEMLDSVLFACRVTQHRSTGYSPFQMLYNKDPILPFEYADQSDNLEPESVVLGAKSSSDISDSDPISDILNKMEAQRKQIFQGAEQNIKKAQSEQAKWYNIQNGAGQAFEVSQYVLKLNKWQLLRKQKLYQCFLGPYRIVSRCSTGNWYLLDCYGHCLSRSVPSNQLVRFFHKKKYKTKHGKIQELHQKNLVICLSLLSHGCQMKILLMI